MSLGRCCAGVDEVVDSGCCGGVDEVPKFLARGGRSDVRGDVREVLVLGAGDVRGCCGRCWRPHEGAVGGVGGRTRVLWGAEESAFLGPVLCCCGRGRG